MTTPPGVGEGAVTPGEPQAPGVAPPSVQLPHGSELTLSEAASLARELTTRVVALAGAVESGKTTILTCLYESFRKGPVAGHQFAGSRTLLAFEKRCHPARMDSGRANATTDRTRQVETRLLHLKVLADDGSPPRHLLLTDISGETFRQARDFAAEVQKLSVLKRADHLAILVDGAKVVSTTTRDAAVTNARSFLKRALGAAMIGKKTVVEVIHSKMDLVQSAQDASSVLSYIDATEDRFRQEFSSHLGALHLFRIAARPSGDVLPFAYKIPELLDAWVRESRLFGELARPIPPSTSRQFERFTWPPQE